VTFQNPESKGHKVSDLFRNHVMHGVMPKTPVRRLVLALAFEWYYQQEHSTTAYKGTEDHRQGWFNVMRWVLTGDE